MKISYNWLKHYLELEPAPDKVAELLTGCGLEVENIDHYFPLKGGLEGIVIGEVLTCEKHPQSDHLYLTTVNIGSGEPLHIVCGAENVAAGQKVPVATLGATLYFNDKEMKLRKTKIKGEVSEGMICAEDELGLGTSHAGIMVLDPSARVGTPAKEYFKVEEDHIFEIGLTPNRSDAASHTGVARDLAAILDKQLHFPDVSAFQPDNDRRKIEVMVDDLQACPRYSGLTILDVEVKESPVWLKNRLSSVGLRPINNIVDITNFILFELGQPLHAFDADAVTGDKIIVKKLPPGTRFITLDGIERELTIHDLMICNATEPMCIAGVFGGINSGVTEKTKNIFLESAYFDPRTIRKTARYHGLQTDASFRFERGANYDITVFALKRAALLIKEIAGGEISSDIVDVYPVSVPQTAVELSYHNLDRLIGKVIDRDSVKNILLSLGMTFIKEDTSGLTLGVPAFKADVTREADVIEEVLRIYGYNNVDFPSSIRSVVSFISRPDPEKVQNMISGYLVSCGFYEMMNNSLTKSAYYEEDPLFGNERTVRIHNPSSRDLDILRQTLLFGGLESILYNQNRKIYDVKLFEFGKVYHKTSVIPGKDEKNILDRYQEAMHLALFLSGNAVRENWNVPEKKTDFYDLKGYVNAILLKLGLDLSGITTEPVLHGLFSEGLVYRSGQKEIVSFGRLTKKLLKNFDFKQDMLYADFYWDDLLSILPIKDIEASELPKFPEVRRDLALLLDQSVTFAEIEKLAFEAESKILRKVGLFDVYKGEKIGKGKKSYAVSFILRDEDKTLTDEEIENVMNTLINTFIQKLNAQIR